MNARSKSQGQFQQLLTFSRKVEPVLQALDLGHEVRQAVGILERTIPKMISIEMRSADHLLPIMADANQLHQVLMNLGANARDAMPDGGRLVIEVENRYVGGLESRPGMPPGQYVLLVVTDSGQGMDAETLKHIFDPFYTTKDVGQGTGLGLWICYQVIRRHGGRIRIDTVEGNGTAVIIEIPLGPPATNSRHLDETIEDVALDQLMDRAQSRAIGGPTTT